MNTRSVTRTIILTASLTLANLALGADSAGTVNIEEIKGATIDHFTLIPNRLELRISARGIPMKRCGILVCRLEEMEEGAPLVDDKGNWKPVCDGEPKVWLRGSGGTEIVELVGPVGLQTFALQAVADPEDGSTRIYSEPEITRISIIDTESRRNDAAVAGKPKKEEQPGGVDEDGDDWLKKLSGGKRPTGAVIGGSRPIPHEPKVAGDWQSLHLYPGHELREAAMVGKYLYAILDESFLVELDLEEMRQTRSLKLPRRVERMRGAGQMLGLLLTKPNELISVDPKTLESKSLAKFSDSPINGFSGALTRPVVAVVDEGRDELTRADLRNGKVQKWTPKQIHWGTAKRPTFPSFSRSIALGVDGAGYTSCGAVGVHRVRFAGERLEIKEVGFQFERGASSYQGHIRSLGNQGIIAVSSQCTDIRQLFPDAKRYWGKVWLLFKPDDLKVPVGFFPASGYSIDVDDERGLISSGGFGDRMAVFAGSRMPAGRPGYQATGSAASKHYAVRSRSQNRKSPRGERQVLFLGNDNPKIFAVDHKASYLLTLPSWLLNPNHGGEE